MVHKTPNPPTLPAAPKRRGRPRAYDPRQALQRVTESFWKSGYSGTSLDDLSRAANMNRPSLYAAFGSKREMYLRALDQYWVAGFAAMRESLSGTHAVREELLTVYRLAVEMYLPTRGRPRGCFAIGTALTEAVEDPQIRAALVHGLQTIDAGFEARLRVAQANGELHDGASPPVLATLASAMLHSIAIRARAGASRQSLEALARNTVDIICTWRIPASEGSTP